MHLFIFSDPVFQRTFLDNPLEDYVWLSCILLAGFLFKRYISKFLTRQLYRICKKYATGVGPDVFLDLLIAPFNLFVMLFITYLAFYRLEYPDEWHLVAEHEFGLRFVVLKTYQVMIVASVTWIFLRLTDYFGLNLLHRASLTQSKTDDQLVPFIKESIKIVIVLFFFLFVLGSIFHVNVASLIAGLGIGGIAVALAAKESLENLIGSFTIFLDKPFTVGDLIRIESTTGHVEEIGFRSTRIRTQDKTYVTVPNKKMVDGILENLTLRELFRAHFIIGLTYESNPEKIRQVTSEILKLLENDSMIEGNSLVRFKEFNSSSLDLIIQFFIKTTEWEEYLLVRERINFAVMDIIKNNGCSFAYPTQRTIVDNQVSE